MEAYVELVTYAFEALAHSQKISQHEQASFQIVQGCRVALWALDQPTSHPNCDGNVMPALHTSRVTAFSGTVPSRPMQTRSPNPSIGVSSSVYTPWSRSVIPRHMLSPKTIVHGNVRPLQRSIAGFCVQATSIRPTRRGALAKLVQGFSFTSRAWRKTVWSTDDAATSICMHFAKPGSESRNETHFQPSKAGQEKDLLVVVDVRMRDVTPVDVSVSQDDGDNDSIGSECICETLPVLGISARRAS